MLNAVGNCYFASFGNLNETFCLGKILQYYIFLSIYFILEDERKRIAARLLSDAYL